MVERLQEPVMVRISQGYHRATHVSTHLQQGPTQDALALFGLLPHGFELVRSCLHCLDVYQLGDTQLCLEQLSTRTHES